MYIRNDIAKHQTTLEPAVVHQGRWISLMCKNSRDSFSVKLSMKRHLLRQSQGGRVY